MVDDSDARGLEPYGWRMIRDLQDLVTALNEQSCDANFNTLGEIQGRGSELDRTLGEIATMRKLIETIAEMR